MSYTQYRDMSYEAQQLRAAATMLAQRLSVLQNVAVWAGADSRRFTLEFDELVVDKITSCATRLDDLRLPDVI